MGGMHITHDELKNWRNAYLNIINLQVVVVTSGFSGHSESELETRKPHMSHSLSLKNSVKQTPCPCPALGASQSCLRSTLELGKPGPRSPRDQEISKVRNGPMGHGFA